MPHVELGPGSWGQKKRRQEKTFCMRLDTREQEPGTRGKKRMKKAVETPSPCQKESRPARHGQVE
ncbi:hypothetical protein IAQ61_010702 [Plenodomus lingam]|uniref:uncharacterized protein n=1 Tax=Leptosphaeria maculans TaxID=5022 RepID=UPI0033288CD3|nr:hypothetical protein IAQ61_010702 [Plenodomus lingam]